jgi:hypothetical protein
MDHYSEFGLRGDADEQLRRAVRDGFKRAGFSPAALLHEVASGKLTPEEAEPVSAMLGAHLKTIERVDIDRRVRDLESKMIVRK